MSHDDLILYVGDPHAPVIQERWFIAQSVDEALGMYITYMPEAIILDGENAMAREVFDHLSDVTHATPRTVEAMLVLNAAWEPPPRTIMNYACKGDDLQRAIDDLLQARELV